MAHARMLLLWMPVLLHGVAGQPNIVLLLTDDEDVVLGSPSLMPNTNRFFVAEGMELRSMFATTPVCCPSRSSFLTGRHIHNLHVRDNSIEGNCSSVAWQNGPEKQSFAVFLEQAGYLTAYFGKYLNNYGSMRAGGTAHIPPGWKEWNGLVGNSQYYNYTLSVNGAAEFHGDDYAQDYLTDIVKNRSLAFIRGAVKSGAPFFAMVAPPAAHDPTEPAPQYAHMFPDIKAPQTPNYGCANSDKHWFVRSQGGNLSTEKAAYADLLYRRRVLTLLSVDDLVGALVQELETLGLTNNTYVFYTADNGYHTGQFGIMKDKRLPYEMDVRLPGYVRGPTIRGGSKMDTAVLNIDFAPTFLHLAGFGSEVTGPIAAMDGKSFADSVLGQPLVWEERSFLLEYNGEGRAETGNMFCAAVGPEMNTVEPRWNRPAVRSCQDARNNTYRCVRTVGRHVNEQFCTFPMEDDFVEYYPDLSSDPWQLKNLAPALTPEELQTFHSRVAHFASCAGRTCRPPPNASSVLLASLLWV